MLLQRSSYKGKGDMASKEEPLVRATAQTAIDKMRDLYEEMSLPLSDKWPGKDFKEICSEFEEERCRRFD